MDRQVLTFLSADTAIARSLVATPDTPPERVEALRRAFDATMRDPDFLAEAEKAKLDVDPMPGAEAQKIANSIVNTPPDGRGPRQGAAGRFAEVGCGADALAEPSDGLSSSGVYARL